MSIGFIIALFSGVPRNTLSDAVPYTIAKSFDDDDTIVYTVTGPKVEKTRAFAFALLGFPWVMGGVMLLFTPNANLTAPVWIVYPVLIGVGGLMCWQAYLRLKSATTRHQIEIDRNSGEVAVSKNKPAEEAFYSNASIVCYPNDAQDNHLATISYGEQFVFVIGAFKKSESALLFAELVSDETGLHIELAKSEDHVYMASTKRMVGSDDRALRKPIATKCLPIHYQL